MLRLFFDDHPPCSAAGLPSPARDADRMRLLSLRPAPTRHIMPVSDVLRLFSATVSDTMPHVPVDRGAAPVLRRNTPDVWRLIRHIMSVSDTICLVTTPDDESTRHVYTRHFASYSSVSCGLSAPGRAPVPTAFRAPFLCPSRSIAPRNPTPSAPASPSFFRYRPPFPRPAVPRHSVPRPAVPPPGRAPAFCLVSRPRSPRFVSRSAPRQNSTQHIHTRHVGPSFHRQRAPFRAVRSKKNRRIPSVTDMLRRHKKPALQTLFPSDGKDVQTCCVHTRRIMTTRHNTPNTTRHDGNRHNTTTQAARAAIPPHDAVRDPDRNPCTPVMVDRLHAGAAPGPRLLCAPIPPHFAAFPFRSRNAFPSPCPCSEPRNRHASPRPLRNASPPHAIRTSARSPLFRHPARGDAPSRRSEPSPCGPSAPCVPRCSAVHTPDMKKYFALVNFFLPVYLLLHKK